MHWGENEQSEGLPEASYSNVIVRHCLMGRSIYQTRDSPSPAICGEAVKRSRVKRSRYISSSNHFNILKLLTI